MVTAFLPGTGSVAPARLATKTRSPLSNAQAVITRETPPATSQATNVPFLALTVNMSFIHSFPTSHPPPSTTTTISKTTSILTPFSTPTPSTAPFPSDTQTPLRRHMHATTLLYPSLALPRIPTVSLSLFRQEPPVFHKQVSRRRAHGAALAVQPRIRRLPQISALFADGRRGRNLEGMVVDWWV